ncbi:uncharacterized protein BO88DRAFT_145488 [Aspergillus vadensis CBS 113365]|uniref:Secreted protein n=1 Tax=Aspergillus vadensis (strain CBS 113365 / IMI 142717 / IBT 24658) TaxID=1448311 RepID=A0A319BPT4_ASPVC|nr:hypothetical protein BO88DRAFT_145488 [Aspergillus vadensis CBS 113365]PYH65218.1 hypothetical protein BO88DRAFT_145488 [Aspergillus vadensis CBS 113365]
MTCLCSTWCALFRHFSSLFVYSGRSYISRSTTLGQNVSWVVQHVHFSIPRVTVVPDLNGGRWITLTEIAMFKLQ